METVKESIQSTVRMPYTLQETGETVYVEVGIQKALKDCQDEINKWAAIISRIEAGL